MRFLLLIVLALQMAAVHAGLNFQGKSSQQENLIFAVSAYDPAMPCELFKVSPKNKILFQKKLDVPCVDFRPHLTGDGKFYSYLETAPGMPGSVPFGFRVILDEKFNFLFRIPTEFASPDFILLGKDHWIGIEFDLRKLASGKTYLNRIVRETKSGNVLFEWGSHHFIEQTGSEAAIWSTLKPFAGNVIIDYMVINSVALYGESLLISLGTNGVTMVDKKTKKMKWVLGGLADEFGLSHRENNLFTSAATFNIQTSELYLISNRSFEIFGTDNSKVRKYRLNVNEKKLTEIAELRDRKEFFGNMGSLLVSGDTLNLGAGKKVRAGFDFVEIKKGKEIWILKLGSDHYSTGFYREPN